ncbi:MAG: hypothetical protein HUK25_05900 [Treponema sp.]|nr:hypothetical protein [Treponema sp.]
MLLSEKGLTANISFYGMGPAYSTDRKLNETRIAETNYKYSNVRAYLNGINNQLITDGGTVGSNDVNFCIDWTGKGFLQQAFTANQQAKIQETTVDYNVAFTEDMDEDNNWYLIPEEDVQGENTEDKLFLLSINEVSDSEYGFLGNDIRDDRYYIRDDRNRARCATDFALANRSNPDRWMLRSTSGTESVYYIGKGVDEMIYFSRYAMAPSQSYSIVPALWVEIPQ